MARFLRTAASDGFPIEVVSGDIGSLALERGPWTAVVSSDSSYLSHGGGSSGSIWNAAGLDEELANEFQLPLHLGSVVETEAGRLPSRAILHAVTLETDSRARLSLEQCELLFRNLLGRIAALVQGHEPRRVLMPIVGSGGAGLAESVVLEQIAILAAKLDPAGVKVFVAVQPVTDDSAVLSQLRRAYGIIDVPIDLGDWLDMPPEPLARLWVLISAIERLLLELQPSQSDAQPRRQSLASTWSAVAPLLPATACEAGDSHALEAIRLIPEIIDARNRIAHGIAESSPDAILLNTAASALKGLIFAITRNMLGSSSGHLTPDRAQTILRERRGPVTLWDRTRLWRGWGASISPAQPTSRITPTPTSPAASERPTDRDRPADLGVQPSASAGARPRAPLPKVRASRSAASAPPPPEWNWVGEALWPSRPDGGNDAPAAPAPNPVRKLAKLLRALPGEELARLLARLDADDYRGDDDKRLIEYCTRVDPADILDDFGSTQLAKLLARELQTNAKPNATVSQLRDQLLHHLGFRIPGSYPGLSESLEEFRRRRTQLRTGRTAEVRENVRWAAVRLERCIRDLLRFMCLYLFGHGPEVHFKGLLSGAASKDFNKATMGTLFSCLEQLAKEIERSANSDTDGNDPPLKELQGPLSATRLAPKGLEGITKLRNDFTHFEKLGDHRDDAREAKWFFDRTIELLEHWLDADPPIYPTTIVVEEIRYDQWNRRTVKARTDHGHEEIIVCEDALTPGDTYFMYPLSNPLRVDPILIGFRPEE